VSFKQRPDHELEQLSDEKLIAYLRDASSAGDAAAGKRALAILVYGYARDVERRMALRLPSHAVEDAAHDALVRAISAAFDGISVGQFRNWLGTIVDRTAVDWFRKRGRRPVETLLPSEHLGDEESWGEEPASASEAGAVELQLIVDEIMAQLSATHRTVVELHVFDGFSASEVCERVDGMTPDNVAQVASRFRKRLRDALEAADGENEP
jgi:RNA polymerase sigma factor (sigma-70 family)